MDSPGGDQHPQRAAMANPDSQPVRHLGIDQFPV
jgi:hypothetical protein